jgi:hypothetical protein
VTRSFFARDMFHDVFVLQSPDLDGYQGTKNETLTPRRPKTGLETQIRSHGTAGAPPLYTTNENLKMICL